MLIRMSLQGIEPLDSQSCMPLPSFHDKERAATVSFHSRKKAKHARRLISRQVQSTSHLEEI